MHTKEATSELTQDGRDFVRPVLFLGERYGRCTGRNESKLCAACPTAVAAVKEVLLEGDLTGFRGVGVSGGHVKGSTAQGLATSHGLKGDIFPAVSLVGSDGRRYAFSSAEADEGMITAAGVRSFLNSFQAGTLAQALRSEPVQ
eukprot:SAG31_NODE_74_length_27628_cov_18.235642_23_plen_144_part_00